MTAAPSIEKCPRCGSASNVRPKLLLIDEAWVPGPGKDSRLKYAPNLRVDDISPEHLREKPLEQLLDGYYCDSCRVGFVSDDVLSPNRIKR